MGGLGLELRSFHQAAGERHAEAKFARGALLLFEKKRPMHKVRHFFEEASSDDILEAQYTYGSLLSSGTQENEDRKVGAKYLAMDAMAAKEVLLRRQCKAVKIYRGENSSPFAECCYSPIPEILVRRATDNYIWEHISENILKMELTPWSEILHPRQMIMFPQRHVADP